MIDTGAQAMPPAPPNRAGFLVAAVLGPLLLIAIGMWFGTQSDKLQHDRSIARLSYERRIAISDLYSGLVEAESAQRGYVISGDRSFLASYRPARTTALKGIDALSAYYGRQGGEGGQLRRLAQLRGTLSAKFAEMEQVIAARDRGGAQAASSLVADKRGVALMAGAREIVEGLIGDEQSALTDRIAALDGRNRSVQYFVWALELLIAVVWLLGLCALWFARTERHRIELAAHNAAARLRAIFDSTSDGIVIIGQDGRIRAVNGGIARMLGYAQADLVGLDVLSLIDVRPGDEGFAERIGLAGAQVGRPVWVDRSALHRDGGRVAVDIALSPMQVSEDVEIVAAVRDISERKAAERIKDDFVATVSHELRTPLTSVVGSLGLLRAGSVGQLPDAAVRLVEIAENNSRRLIRLINDILDIEKIGSGRMQFESAPVDLVPLARRAVEGARGMAEARRVEFTLSSDMDIAIIHGDAERLLQVLANLISNAIRFSPDGGCVHIGIARDTAHEQGRVIVTVDDEGPGIPAEFQGRMFERFAQAGGAKSSGGTGLGLAISREIIVAHDGRIWFADAPSGGARLAFGLPLPLPVAPASAASHSRILMCVPQTDSADAIRGILEGEGYVVDGVSTAREAERAARSGRYEGMVIDLVLPDATGLDTVRSLRRRMETRDMPVIIVSAETDDGRDPVAAALDVIDWIDKPVDQERLVRAVRTAVRHAAATRPTLLHIDDDVELLEVVATALADQGRMLRATTVAEARQRLVEQTPDIVILDIGLPDGSGIDLLPDLFAADGTAIPTIIYSAIDVLPEVQRQVDAVLVKSRRSLPSLARTIRRVLSADGAQSEVS
jgi:PAS domain S-box-containing protein